MGAKFGCKRPDLAERNRKHGETASGTMTSEYRAWAQMKQRCLNENRKDYIHYGDRGITIYEEWINDYSSFLAHVGRKPASNYTLERIDNNKGYEPGNVKWATQKEQTRNQRKTIFLEFEGRKQSLSDWAEEKGIKYKTLVQRLKMGWSIEHALTIKPVAGQKIYESVALDRA